MWKREVLLNVVILYNVIVRASKVVAPGKSARYALLAIVSNSGYAHDMTCITSFAWPFVATAIASEILNDLKLIEIRIRIALLP